MTTNKFTWGDSIRIDSSAPVIYHPGECGSISGLRQIDNQEMARSFRENIGAVVYIIEFGDGSSIEVPEQFLAKDTRS